MNKFLRTLFVSVSLIFVAAGAVNAQNCTVNAGVLNKTICPEEPFVLVGSSAGLADNPPVWTQIDGPTVSVSATTLVGGEYQATVTGYAKGISYKFRISRTCTDGSIVYQDATYTVSDLSMVSAGPDVTICPSSNTYQLQGSPLGDGETGIWTRISGNGTDPSNSGIPNPTIAIPVSNDITVTTYRWTVTKGTCSAYDDVVITNLGANPTVSAGPDLSAGCFNVTASVTLQGSAAAYDPDNGQIGTWSFISGPSIPNLNNIHANNAVASNLIEGTYKFRWTVEGPCANGSSDMEVHVGAATQTISSAGGNTQVVCDGRSSIILNGANANNLHETVTWTLNSKSGGAAEPVFSATNIQNITVSGLSTDANTEYVFKYHIENTETGCTSDGLYYVRYRSAPTINFAASTVFIECDQHAMVLDYTVTGGTTTQYALLSAPAGSAFQSSIGGNLNQYVSAPASGTELNTFNQVGTYILSFRRFAEDGLGGCSDAYAQLTVVVSATPTVANAGTRQVLACDKTETALAGNLPETIGGIVRGVGKWTQVSGPEDPDNPGSQHMANIVDPFNPTTDVIGMIRGTEGSIYTFRWIISGGDGPCSNSQSDVDVVVAPPEPTVAAAGEPQISCYDTPVLLEGNKPGLNEVGTWTVTKNGTDPAPEVIFSPDIHANDARADKLVANTPYTFIWTITNNCDNFSSDPVTITTTNTPGPKQATIEDDALGLCLSEGATSFQLKGNVPNTAGGEIGKWRMVSGPNTPTFDTNADPEVTDDPEITISNAILGTYIFEWKLERNGCTPTTAQIRVTISNDVTMADVGTIENQCATEVTLTGNTPDNLGESGKWTQIEGPGGVIFADVTDPGTLVSNLSDGRYTFRWTITNNDCGTNHADVTFNVSTPPTPAEVLDPVTHVAFVDEPEIEVCNSSSTAIEGNLITSGTGRWVVVSGPSAVIFGDPTARQTTISGLVFGTYVIQWTSRNGVFCDPTSANLTIKVSKDATATAVNGPNYCDVNSVSLQGTAGSSGTWTSATPGSYSIVPNGSSDAIVTGLEPGTYTFTYTFNTAECATNSANVTITIAGPPSQANAGEDFNECQDAGAEPTSVVLNADVPSVGTGTWTVYQKFLDIGSENTTPQFTSSDPDYTGHPENDPHATITTLTPGIYFLRWEVTNGLCAGANASTDYVRITISTKPVADAGTEIFNACSDNVTLNGNTPKAGGGTWSYISGPEGYVFDAVNNPTTRVTGLVPGDYVFRWTVRNSRSDCPDATSDVEVHVTSEPPLNPANANDDQEVCIGSTVELAGSPFASGESGLWAFVGADGGGTINNADTQDATVTGLAAGTYTLMWTITKGTSCSSSDVMQVVVMPAPSAAHISSGDQTICLYTPLTITTDAIVNGTGSWLVTDKPGGASDPIFIASSGTETDVYGLSVGTYKFKYVVSSGPCEANESNEITIEVTPPATTSSVDPTPLTTCESLSVTLPGNNPSSGTGTWSVVNGPTGYDEVGVYTFSDPNAYNSTFKSDLPGEYVLQWEIVSDGGCAASATTVTVTVLPPVANNTLSASATPVCDGQSTNITGSDPTGGDGTNYTFQWYRSEDNFATAGTPVGGDPKDYNTSNLTNGSLTETKSYYFRRAVTSGPCTTEYLSNIIEIIVLPSINNNNIIAPATTTFCSSGDPDVIADGGIQGGAGAGTYTYKWQESSNGTDWSDISPAQTGATFNPSLLTNSGNTVLNFYYRRVATSGACSNNSSAVHFIVNPEAKINTVSNQSLCNGANTTAVNFSSPTTGVTMTYEWTNTNTAIGLGASGTGNIPVFAAINNTDDVVTATIEVTPKFTNNGVACTGTPVTFTITVNPTPKIDNLPTAVVDYCSVGTINSANVEFAPTSPTQGAIPSNFTWTRDNTANVTGTLSGTGDIDVALTNTTDNIQPVKFTYTASVNDCSNPQEFTVMVNPVPRIIAPTGTELNVCNNGVFAYTLNSPTENKETGSFNWSRPALATGLTVEGSGALASGSGNISETFVNTTTEPITVTYTYSMTVNGCNKEQSFTITVNPTAVINSDLTDKTICSGSNIAYKPTTSTTTGTITYKWSRAAVTGINAGADANGTLTSAQSITEALNNSTNGVLQVVYVITPVINGCDGTPSNLIVNVNPIAKINPVPDQLLCNNASTVPVNFTSPTTGGTVTYNWTNNNTDIGLIVSGNGDIEAFTATNAGNGPIVATITVTPTFTNNGVSCDGTPITFTITVNPTAKVNAVSNQTLCNNENTTAINFSTTNTPANKVTYEWVNDNTSIGLAGSGSGNIASFNANNATDAPLTATIIVTPKYDGSCDGTPVTFTITIKPTPIIDNLATVDATTYCSAGTSNTTNVVFSPVSPTTGADATTFAWTRSNTANVTGTLSGTGDIDVALTNTTDNIQPVKFTYTASVNDCSNPQEFTVMVNPVPRIIAPTGTELNVCNNGVFAYTLNSPTENKETGSFNWSRPALATGLTVEGSGALASGSGNISETFVNTTTEPITVTYTYSMTVNGCNKEQSFTITVNPTAVINSDLTDKTICSGSNIAYKPTTSTTTGTITYKWSRAAVTGINAGADANGTLTSAQSITEALNNSTNGVLQVVYVITPVINGCDGTPSNLIVNVNPIAKINPVPDQLLCNNASTVPVNFTSPTTGGTVTYNWTNNNTDIGLIVSGNGDIEAFTATNAGNGPIVATITVTPTFTNNGVSCDGTPITFTITVNPTAKVNAVSNQTLCNNENTTAINFSTTNTPANKVTYEWVNDNTSIGLAGSGSGNIASFNANNATDAPFTATIIVTPKYDGSCDGTPVTFTITIKPTPIIDNLATVDATTYCSAGTSNTTNVVFSPVSPTTGADATTFAWTRSNTANVTGTLSGTGDIDVALTNTTDNIQPVKFTYTASVNDCSNPQEFTVMVNPVPRIIAPTGTELNVCNNGVFAYTLNSPTENKETGSFNWSRPALATGLTVEGSGALASGSGNISETFVNTTTEPITVTYTYSMTVNGCNKEQSFTITVNPTATVTAVDDQTVCNGAPVTAVNFASPTTGGTITYNWTNSIPSIGLAASGTGNITSFNAVNNGTEPVTATVTVTPTFNNDDVDCVGTPTTFTITVNPTATVTAVDDQTVCNGAPVTAVNFASPTTGGTITYNWTNSIPSIGLAASGTGNITSFNAVNNGTEPVTATVTVTPTFNNDDVDCVGTPTTFTITVNPTATVTAVDDQTVCNGAPVTAVNFASPTTGGTITYNWTNSIPSIGLAASGTGNITSFNAVNNGTEPVTATVTVTPTFNNDDVDCVGTPTTFTITVNPTATVTAVDDQTVCNGAPVTAVNFASPTTGGTITYNWTNSIPSIGLAASGTGNITSFNAVNNGTEPVTATVTVTPTFNNDDVDCVGTPTTFTITVNPTATVTAVDDQTVCNGAPVTAVNFASPTTGGTITYNWTNSIPSIGLAASGTGNITSFNAVNNGTEPVTATVTVTPTFNNDDVDCVGTPTTFTITVNPTAKGFDDNPSVVACSGVLNYDLQANVNNTANGGNGLNATFKWTVTPNTNVTGWANEDGTSNLKTISQTLINRSTSVQQVVYTVTPIATDFNDCASGPTFTVTVTVPVCSQYEVTKTADVTEVTKKDDIITYTVKVKNTGHADQTNVDLADPFITTTPTLVKTDGETTPLNDDDILAKGETWTYTYTYQVTQADIDNNGKPFPIADPDDKGKIINTVSVTTTEIPAAKTANATVNINATAGFTITKTSDIDPLTGITEAGQVVNYEIAVENTSASAIRTVNVVDPMLPDLSYDSGDDTNPLVLDVGETWIYKGSYTVKQSDIDNYGNSPGTAHAGKLYNKVTASGIKPDDTSTGDITDEVEIPITAVSSFTVTKTTTTPVVPIEAKDDVVPYTIVVTNTGQTAITDVLITDALIGTMSGPTETGGTGDNSDGILNVGETWTYTATYTVPQSLIDNKGNPVGTDELVNEVLVDGKRPDGTDLTQISANVSTPVTQNPAVTLTKTAVAPFPTKPGEFINYELVVTNTGNVTLFNVEVTDPNAVITGGTIATLAPGANETITATHEVTKADITDQKVTNQAVVNGDKNVSGGDPISEDSDDPTITDLPHDPTVVPLLIPPYADDDESLDNTPGATVIINILSNDQIATTDPALPTDPNVDVDLDLDPGAPGVDHTLVVAGKGTWTYDPATGNVTFEPVPGYTISPPVIPYRLIEKHPANPDMTADATIKVTYLVLPPVAEDDTESGFAPGTNAVVNILTNDKLSDESPALTMLVDVNLVPGSATPEHTLTVTDEGTWTYDPATGEVTFDPEDGYTADPTAINYDLIETLTGEKSTAVITIHYDKVPPIASDDEQLDVVPGVTASVNVLTNDKLSDGTDALPKFVDVDLDLTTPGIQHELTVAIQGTWTYDPLTGIVNFIPNPGFTIDPTPVDYVLTEKYTDLTDQAKITITYLPVPPDAVNDFKSGTAPGATVVVDILTNDQLADKTPAEPGLVDVDLDPSTAGINDHTLTVSNEGTWTYDPVAGTVTFVPIPGFTIDPTPVDYVLTELITGLKDQATIAVSYSKVPPEPVNDVSDGNMPGNPASLNIIDNDKLSDGSSALLSKIIVDIDVNTAGVQDELVVAGEGTWKYDPATGIVKFTPNIGFGISPTQINYTLKEVITNLTKDATIKVNYLGVEPVAADDRSEGNAPGTNATLNILTNDKLSDGSPATPTTITADLDVNTPGVQTTLAVVNQGTWTYDPATGDVTFDPNTGFTANPAPITYILRETLTGLSDNAVITVIYTSVVPDAVDDSSTGNLVGTNVTLNILANDKLSDGSPATTALVTVDLDPNTTGTQTTLTVVNQGKWTYDATTGNLTFDPNTGFGTSPTPIPYILRENNTGLTDRAMVTITYTGTPSAVNDVSGGNIPGKNAIVNILTNDKLSDGTTAVPAKVTVDLDLNTSGTQTTLTVVGQGKWTYDPATGKVTFDPVTGFNSSPTPISYKLIETNTGLTADALIAVPYAEVPPDAVNDAAVSNTPGIYPTVNILSNDKLADGSRVTTTNVTVDMDIATAGIQATRTVAGEGTWSYNAGIVTFTPVPGYIANPTPVTYRITELTTGLTDDATITVTTNANLRIGVAKSAIEVVRGLNSSYTITYGFTVTNYGNLGLTDVSVIDNLRSVFQVPMDITVINVAATGTLKANNAYTGTGNNNLLLAESTLPIGKTETIKLVINVKPNSNYGIFQNTATASGIGEQVGGTATDISTSGTNPDPNGNNDPSDADEDRTTPVLLAPMDVIIPEGFSPNGDGVNDEFVIDNPGGGRVDLEMYNRWGNIVFRDKDYKNTWNGTCNVGIYLGKQVPDGTYYYIVKIDNKPGEVKFITINR